VTAILVVAADNDLESLTYWLRRGQVHLVTHCDSTDDATNCFESREFYLVLIDYGFPDERMPLSLGECGEVSQTFLL